MEENIDDESVTKFQYLAFFKVDKSNLNVGSDRCVNNVGSRLLQFQ